MNPVVGPATAQDFIDFVGTVPPYRVLAWCGKLDGKVIAIGGVMFMPDGGKYAFLDALPEARTFHKSLHQGALRFMSKLRQLNIGPFVATTTTNVPRANEWLLRLGFKCHEIGETRVFVHAGQSDG